jgi:hypothetical protein
MAHPTIPTKKSPPTFELAGFFFGDGTLMCLDFLRKNLALPAAEVLSVIDTDSIIEMCREHFSPANAISVKKFRLKTL